MRTLLRSLETAHLASWRILNGKSSIFVVPGLGRETIRWGDGVKALGIFSIPR